MPSELIVDEIEEMSETTVESLLITISYLDKLYKNCSCYCAMNNDEMKNIFHKMRVDGQIVCEKTQL